MSNDPQSPVPQEADDLERLLARLEDEREEAKDLSRIGTPWDPLTAQRIANTMFDAAAEITRLRAENAEASTDYAKLETWANAVREQAENDAALAKQLAEALEGIVTLAEAPASTSTCFVPISPLRNARAALSAFRAQGEAK